MSTTPQIQRRKGFRLLLVLALAFLLVGSVLLARSLLFVLTYSSTQGLEIVNCATNLQRADNKSNDCAYNTAVTYRANGERYVDTFNALPLVLDNPARVTVLYNPHNPQEEQVASFTNLWLWPYLALFASLFFLVLIVARASVNRLIARKEEEWAGVRITGYL